MDENEVNRVRARLALYVADVFASVPRKDQRAKGDCYLRGLMLDGRRKSIQAMAASTTAGDLVTGLRLCRWPGMMMDVTAEQIAEWDAELAVLTGSLGYLFNRPEPKVVFAQFIEGLLAELPKKNGWTLSDRCLGSDDYRYEGGRVCTNKPVRADYLDTVVWDHVIGLIADPHLIRTEIDKRLERARTSDPATRERGRLEAALAKATAAIIRMIEAFQEQLVTLDELRSRMPDLRARESNLRSQLHALDTQIADLDAYLKLADDLEGFLAQLRDNAESAEVPERQRVLRLLVKDVLIGPEKITIRHRIPVREHDANDGQHQDQDATEGDSCPSYPLRWGRDHSALRSSRLGRGEPSSIHGPGLQSLPDQSPGGESAERGHQPFMVDP
ncbi:transposase, partial [Streptomyces sp. NPDC097610]|uniref:transposase n=1 Tax=Streptomyces sp. NPDC097610 TaxID=3157227 RepID=UPI00332494BC